MASGILILNLTLPHSQKYDAKKYAVWNHHFPFSLQGERICTNGHKMEEFFLISQGREVWGAYYPFSRTFLLTKLKYIDYKNSLVAIQGIHILA